MFETNAQKEVKPLVLSCFIHRKRQLFLLTGLNNALTTQRAVIRYYTVGIVKDIKLHFQSVYSIQWVISAAWRTPWVWGSSSPTLLLPGRGWKRGRRAFLKPQIADTTKVHFCLILFLEWINNTYCMPWSPHSPKNIKKDKGPEFVTTGSATANWFTIWDIWGSR